MPIRSRIERAGGADRHHIGAVHGPDHGRAVVVLPQDVGLAVAVEVAGALDLPARPRIERADGADGGAGGAVAAILGAMPAMSVRPWQLTDLNRPAGFEQRIPGQHGFRVIETVGSHTDVPGKVSRH